MTEHTFTMKSPDGLAVSGASGRIGRRLYRVWAEADVVWHGRSDGPLVSALDGRDVLVALGGVTAGTEADLEQNAAAALNALDAAARAGLRRVFLFSSAAVYGRREGRMQEDMPLSPAAPYGAAKAAQETAVARWRDANPAGPEAVTLRLGNVAGADALLGGLGRATPRLDVFADGTAPRRSYIGPASLARVLAALAHHPGPLPAVLNLAAPGVVGMDDLLQAAGRDWIPVPAPAEAIRRVEMDTSRLKALVPFTEAEADPAEMVRQWRATGASA